jgi:Tfp pilus assembly protein PilF
MSRVRIVASGVLTLMTAVAGAQEHQHLKSEKLGTVHFATSCNATAQQEIDHAVALLHSFQFARAIERFDAALKADTGCGVAYWGIALSQWSNPFAAGAKDEKQLQAGRDAVRRGLKAGAQTERESAYLAAVGKLYEDFEKTGQRARLVAYCDAMRELVKKYPQDDEGAIFYALGLAASEDPNDKTYARRLEAGAILEKLFERAPEHPGLAHYIIHTYDVPPLAARATAAAHRYSDIAPDAPHALHMPSHTFTRTGAWQESIDTNVAAVAAARRERQTGEELHASDYQMYAYLQTAQDAAARRLLDTLPEIASRFDPRVVISGAAGPPAGYFAMAAIPARYALERRDWKQAAQLTPRDTPFPYTDAITWLARGIGAARLGDVASARQAAAALDRIRGRLVEAGESYWAQQVDIQGREVMAWAALGEGNTEDALRHMRSAAELEDGTDKSAVTPGPLAPARELLGEMLLETNDPAQALDQFEATLKREPKRFHALYGAARAAQLSGKPDVSRTYYRELVQICERGDTPGRQELAEARSALISSRD